MVLNVGVLKEGLRRAVQAVETNFALGIFAAQVTIVGRADVFEDG